MELLVADGWQLALHFHCGGWVAGPEGHRGNFQFEVGHFGPRQDRKRCPTTRISRRQRLSQAGRSQESPFRLPRAVHLNPRHLSLPLRPPPLQNELRQNRPRPNSARFFLPDLRVLRQRPKPHAWPPPKTEVHLWRQTGHYSDPTIRLLWFKNPYSDRCPDHCVLFCIYSCHNKCNQPTLTLNLRPEDSRQT